SVPENWNVERKRSCSMPNQLKKDPSRSFLFLPTLVGVFLITVIYPIAMAINVPIAYVFQYARNDLAWSFHSLFLVPIAFALLVTAFNKDLILGISGWQRSAWVFIYLLLIIFLCWGAIYDRQILPTPDRSPLPKAIKLGP